MTTITTSLLFCEAHLLYFDNQCALLFDQSTKKFERRWRSFSVDEKSAGDDNASDVARTRDGNQCERAQGYTEKHQTLDRENKRQRSTRHRASFDLIFIHFFFSEITLAKGNYKHDQWARSFLGSANARHTRIGVAALNIRVRHVIETVTRLCNFNETLSTFRESFGAPPPPPSLPPPPLPPTKSLENR